MSPSPIPSRSAVTARAKEGSGAILRRGGALSISPQLQLLGSSPLALFDR
jgi:hypothetical protein